MRMLAKLGSFFSGNLLGHLVDWYKRIPSLYKTTFWTVFIALNIVFAYHTAHFIWGNHEWVYMRTGMTWKGFWYEARFTETLPYALFGFELLPILLNEFAFMGISLSLLCLAIYWRLPKEKWLYVGFGLMMAFIPYNLSWLYHVAQSSFLWGCTLIIAALTILEKIAAKKISFLWHIAIIFILWFTLGFNAAFINTIFICLIGRCLIDLCHGEGLGKLIKKGVMGLIDIILAGGLLKWTIALADKYGYLGDNFYNVNTIKFNEVWDKLKEVAGYTIEQFTITYPFFEWSCLYLMWIFLGLAILTLLWCVFSKNLWKGIISIMGFSAAIWLTQYIPEPTKMLSHIAQLKAASDPVPGLFLVEIFLGSLPYLIALLLCFTPLFFILKKQLWARFVCCLICIAGILFASQFAIFISENRIKLQFMFRLTGFFSLYFIFALAFAVLAGFWSKQFFRNILFILMVAGTGLFIQRDMYAMRVWKQGLDAENKIYDRVMARIESLEGFSYDKRYKVVIVGDPSLRDRYYQGNPSDKDASVLAWSYRCPWTYQAYLNFYAPQDFIDGEFQNAWGQQYTAQLFPQFSEASIHHIADHAAAWPAPGSVMIRDGIILIFMDKNETRTFKRLLANYYKEWQDFQFSDHVENIQVFHPDWGRAESLKFITRDRVMRPHSGDTATVHYIDDKRLVLKWDNFGTENFYKNGAGIYEYSDKAVSDSIAKGIILASHKDWPPAWKPQGLQFISKNKVMRIANNDIAEVKKYTDDELVLEWYAYGTERFKKDENGIYRFVGQ